MKKLVCMLMAFIMLCPVNAFANSAPVAWDGMTGYGAVITDEKCPLVVEKEILTLDIDVLPDGWINKNEIESYTSKVTAEYTFYNPADYDVNATLVFPFGNEPDYSDYSPLFYDYNVLTDGQAVEKEVRYTFSQGEFDTVTEMSKIADTYRKSSLFSPEMTVTKYVYSAKGFTEDKYKYAYVGLQWTNENDERFLLFESVNSFRSLGKNTASIYESVGIEDELVFYIIGKPLENDPEIMCWFNGEGHADKVSLEEKRKMTFEGFIIDEWCADQRPDGINDADWYNLFVDGFTRYRMGEKAIIEDFCTYENLKEEVMLWYRYDISVGAGRKVTNSVTAPLFPSINMRMEPPVYGYDYLLSPATQWAEFGELEININTPFYILESSIDGFEKTEKGYTYKSDGLPRGELQLTICSEENAVSTVTKRNVSLYVLIAMMIISVAIVLTVKKKNSVKGDG